MAPVCEVCGQGPCRCIAAASGNRRPWESVKAYVESGGSAGTGRQPCGFGPLGAAGWLSNHGWKIRRYNLGTFSDPDERHTMTTEGLDVELCRLTHADIEAVARLLGWPG